MRVVGREAYRTTMVEPISCLQPSWGKQQAFLRLAGVTFKDHGTQNFQDLRNHALHAAMEEADDHKLPRPILLTSGVNSVFADLGTGETISFNAFATPAIVDRVLKGWDSFLGANFVVKV